MTGVNLRLIVAISGKKEVLQEMALMTIEDMKKRFGVDQKTIYNWRKHRGMPFIKIGKEIYFREESIQQWLEQKEKVAK
ncbi:DNA binding protein [Bacillus phage 031MP004]|nr:DNA binding protein [Bacillus phage 022DV001]QFG05463.1 DNA binding protein [Bacillus phage 031MP003]QFG05552.1 DNA binding protein [Bacillus phage 031MP002]QFG05639.1 DNA binding protein [Bacillus phage 031MP004]QFG05811.1 DNA binding protein [Bacillus phage 055SW001]